VYKFYMKEEIPDLIKTFVNYIWVYLPKDWSVEHKYEKFNLYVNIRSKDASTNRPVSVRRKYSGDIIKKFKDNVQELAFEAAKEIITVMNKKVE